MRQIDTREAEGIKSALYELRKEMAELEARIGGGEGLKPMFLRHSKAPDASQTRDKRNCP